MKLNSHGPWLGGSGALTSCMAGQDAFGSPCFSDMDRLLSLFHFDFYREFI